MSRHDAQRALHRATAKANRLRRAAIVGDLNRTFRLRHAPKLPLEPTQGDQPDDQPATVPTAVAENSEAPSER